MAIKIYTTFGTFVEGDFESIKNKVNVNQIQSIIAEDLCLSKIKRRFTPFRESTIPLIGDSKMVWFGDIAKTIIANL